MNTNFLITYLNIYILAVILLVIISIVGIGYLGHSLYKKYQVSTERKHK